MMTSSYCSCPSTLSHEPCPALTRPSQSTELDLGVDSRLGSTHTFPNPPKYLGQCFYKLLAEQQADLAGHCLHPLF